MNAILRRCALVWLIATAPACLAASPARTVYPVPEPVMSRCVAVAAKTYNIPPIVLRALHRQEGGKIGTISRNTDGSFDLGPMQINTINLPAIKSAFPFLTWRHIVYEPCVNVMVSAWFLRQKIDGRGGNLFEGVGDYHSRTPAKRIVYLRSFLRHYDDIRNSEHEKQEAYRADILKSSGLMAQNSR